MNDSLLLAALASMATALQVLAQTDKPTQPSMAEVRPDQPFTNTLGMKFVPVPIHGGLTGGKTVLFSIWETRVKDYQTYASENSGVDDEFKSPGFNQTGEHPVVNVSWEDANAFSAWLTRNERAAGKIGLRDTYRLPTDHEWSCTVGIGPQEDPRASPSDKAEKIKGVFPYGTRFPPPHNAGNYNTSLSIDSVEYTSPVGRFTANKLGLFDLGGNVWEWCEDAYRGSPTWRVLRGASWLSYDEVGLLSSFRISSAPGFRIDVSGFRVVLERSSP